MAGFFDQEYDESVAAAMIAVNLFSYERYMCGLDQVYTKYSAQYLLDKLEAVQGETDGDSSKLTAKDCLVFAMNQGIPQEKHWSHFGCPLKFPSFYNPPLVSMKGQLVEPTNLDEAIRLHQPIGASLHVFSPQIHDHVEENGIYGESSFGETHCVGLIEVMIVGVKKIAGEQSYATVKIFYKNKITLVNVALNPQSPLLVGFLAPHVTRKI